MSRPTLLPAVILWLAFAANAAADPCRAIPDHGPMPAGLASGHRFQGPVVYVGDGDSLCVALGKGADTWVEVRLADFYAVELSAPGGREARSALETLAKGRTATCVAQHRSHDRVVARCAINGVSIGDRLRRAGLSEGGRGR